jgi:hypothetical protein
VTPGRLTALLLGAPCVARTAAAQVVTAAASVSFTEHRVDAGYGVERSSGVLGGGRVTLGLPPRVELDVTAASGTLERDSANAEDRHVAEIGFDARYRPLSWLWLETGIATRTYSAPIAVQRWTSLRLGAEARVPFFGGRAEGVGRLLFLPLVSVTGLEQPELALTAAAGVEYRLGPIAAGVFYSLERYDFSAQDGVARAEQLSALTVRASARLLSFGSR